MLKKIIKKFVFKIIFSYQGYLLFDFINRLTGYKKERLRISREIGYYPSLKNPRSFNEKVLWKKIYDKNPLLPLISDKYRVRDYLKEVLGEQASNNILIPMLYITDRPENIPFDTLTDDYIIKPNHASGWLIIKENIEARARFKVIYDNNTTILNDSKKTRNEIINICKNWLSRPYGFYQHEWAYQKIVRKILIEKLLYDNTGNIPCDYKFHIFNGKCRSIVVVCDKFIDKLLDRYTENWEYLNVGGHSKKAGYRKKPEKLNAMIEFAELLGKPFDYIRVDLYLINDQIYFGEMTSYVNSACTFFEPVSFDYELGAMWKIKPKYWK